MGRKPVWFFDLDNTLHDASHRIFGAINRTMTDYVMRHLDLDEDAANRLRVAYWQRYGATLLGLVRHHAVDAHHFLRETHDFSSRPEFVELLRFESGLTRLMRQLPGRKVLLTNAPARYANAVLGHMGLQRQFRRRYAIEQMRIHGRFRPKPSRSMLRALLAREGVAARRAILVEDSAENLRAARAVGMRTVLVTGHTPRGRRDARHGAGLGVPLCKGSRPGYVDLQVESVRHLRRAARFLR